MKRILRVAPRLYQSGCPVDVDDVNEAGINAVVDVGDMVNDWQTAWAKGFPEGFGPDNPRRRAFLHIPLHDAPGFLDPVAAETAAEAVLRFLGDTERRVLIHCDAGAYRSRYVTALVLAEGLGCDGPTALKAFEYVAGYREPSKEFGFMDWDQHLQSWKPTAVTCWVCYGAGERKDYLCETMSRCGRCGGRGRVSIAGPWVLDVEDRAIKNRATVTGD